MLIELLIIFLPVPLELVIDKFLYFNKGKSDKPWSTIMRACIFAAFAGINAFLLGNHLFAATFLAQFFVFAGLFDPLVNLLVLKKHWNYHPIKPGLSGFWEKIWLKTPPHAELFFRLVAIATGLLTYFKWPETFFSFLNF